jgi:hypothetical protein
MGRVTGFADAEHSPPPQKQGSGDWSGTAFPAVPSTKHSRRGLAARTAAPKRSAPARQSVAGLPSPQDAAPWGSLFRSAPNTFQAWA